MSEHLHWDPDHYLEQARAELPAFDEFQAQAVAAIEGHPIRVLELGIGTGETTRRLLKRFPDAKVLGLDSSPAMCFRARELGIDVQMARMEDPLPDGPWDLVISVLAIHHVSRAQKPDLFRRIREQASQLVIGEMIGAGGDHGPELDFPRSVDELAGWCDGEIAWAQDDLAVIRASY